MTGSFRLDDYLAGHAPTVEAALERAVAALDGEISDEVRAALHHGVTGGGKRLRPILCVAAYEACGGRSAPELFDLAAALELVHAYSLMHDDLPCMDDAELRRGRPTTHRIHGEELTMSAGAALIPAAARQALRATRGLGGSAATAARVAGILVRASGAAGMVGGQWLDLEGEGRLLTEAELDELHRHKTGALLVAALQMGAAAAGADASSYEALTRYGGSVGLAFQVADDILDATGDAAVLGKNPSDQALEKSTYVSFHGLDEARARAEALVADAKRALAEGGLSAPALAGLADFVVERRN